MPSYPPISILENGEHIPCGEIVVCYRFLETNEALILSPPGWAHIKTTLEPEIPDEDDHKQNEPEEIINLQYLEPVEYHSPVYYLKANKPVDILYFSKKVIEKNVGDDDDYKQSKHKENNNNNNEKKEKLEIKTVRKLYPYESVIELDENNVTNFDLEYDETLLEFIQITPEHPAYQKALEKYEQTDSGFLKIIHPCKGFIPKTINGVDILEVTTPKYKVIHKRGACVQRQVAVKKSRLNWFRKRKTKKNKNKTENDGEMKWIDGPFISQHTTCIFSMFSEDKTRIRILYPVKGWIKFRMENGDLLIKPLKTASETMLDLDNNKWFYIDEYRLEQGPFTKEILKIKYHDGDINPNTTVWNTRGHKSNKFLPSKKQGTSYVLNDYKFLCFK